MTIHLPPQPANTSRQRSRWYSMAFSSFWSGTELLPLPLPLPFPCKTATTCSISVTKHHNVYILYLHRGHVFMAFNLYVKIQSYWKTSCSTKNHWIKDMYTNVCAHSAWRYRGSPISPLGYYCVPLVVSVGFLVIKYNQISQTIQTFIQLYI